MRTIIAGSRSACCMQELEAAIKLCGWKPTVVLSGTAKGADTLGQIWAVKNRIPLERYPANWNANGRKAGMMRNKVMAANAEALIALWDGESPGTQNMMMEARKAGLRVFMVRSL